MSVRPLHLPYDLESQLVGRGCMDCAYLTDLVEGTCLAFPHRIPEAIRQDRVRHDCPFPGDGGIQFKQAASRLSEAP